MNILFDIIIPLGPNDLSIVKEMINYTKKNIVGYRNIYIVSYDSSLYFDDCIIINENIFPFSKKILENYIGNNDRVGWYLQQLIKLYSGFYIKNILDNYLVIDSDTYFLKPTTFFKNNLPLYNIGTEYNIPYFQHMNKLHPSLNKVTNYSGICHHMLFQKNILYDLFILVENYHKTKFYIAFLNCINQHDILGSGASEYEIYFNYLHIYHKNKFIIRQLEWTNTNNLCLNSDYDYISYHWYSR